MWEGKRKRTFWAFEWCTKTCFNCHPNRAAGGETVTTLSKQKTPKLSSLISPKLSELALKVKEAKLTSLTRLSDGKIGNPVKIHFKGVFQQKKKFKWAQFKVNGTELNETQ